MVITPSPSPLDTEIMDLRMVLSGKICGIPGEAIKERLRDVNV